MSRACRMVLAAYWVALTAWAQIGPRVTTIGPSGNVQARNLPQYAWLYSKSIPPAARDRLFPLYQEADSLLQELSALRPGLMYEVASGLGPLPTSEAPSTVEESAARSGRKDAQYLGVDAFSSAQLAADSTSADRVRSIVERLDIVSETVHDVQQQFGIETIGPAPQSPWSALFQRPKLLSSDEVRKLLLPACSRGFKARTVKPCKPAVLCIRGKRMSTRMQYPTDL